APEVKTAKRKPRQARPRFPLQRKRPMTQRNPRTRRSRPTPRNLRKSLPNPRRKPNPSRALPSPLSMVVPNPTDGSRWVIAVSRIRLGCLWDCIGRRSSTRAAARGRGRRVLLIARAPSDRAPRPDQNRYLHLSLAHALLHY